MADRGIRPRLRRALPALVCYMPLAMGQWRWTPDQVNTTMCYWEQLRAAVVQDTVYMDGGRLWWLPGLASGQYDTVVDDHNPRGIVYSLNFSVPFETSQNFTALLGQLSKAPGAGAATNWGPDYVDGGMLANDHEFFLYGGLLRDTDEFATPHEDDVTEYQQSQYGVHKDGFSPSFYQGRLPPGITRYLAYGGGASAPSENKAWYFSGLRAPGWGEVFTVGANESLTAVNVSDTLITLDMATQQQERWTNDTLPASVHGRANPELVWVPVGEEGILVAVGGVVYPEFVTDIHVSDNEPASEQQSPKFMTTIDVYDVASKTWYQQPTAGGPGQLTRFCAVVAPAQDHSSFNIYLHGGYDGLHVSDPGAFNVDVWVLSIPSFTWTRTYAGTAADARAGHKCVMPYPDLMMVIGGSAALQGQAPACVGMVRLFNLSSLAWQTRYDPEAWADYAVPAALYRKIGGAATGGATVTSPASAAWAASALGAVFATPYPASKLRAWHTYAPAPSPTNGTQPSYTAVPKKKSGSGVPSFLAPLLGTILGLIFLTSAGVAVVLWRRRRYLKAAGGGAGGSRRSDTDTATDDTGNRILAWMRGQQAPGPGDRKDNGVATSDGTPSSPSAEMEQVAGPPRGGFAHEMPDTHIVELADTSPRAELFDTGLSPIDIIARHSHFAPGAAAAAGGGAARAPNGPPSSSPYSSIAQTDHAGSVVSQPSSSAAAAARPDSPPLGKATGAAAPRGESGVSDLSDRDRAHLRKASDPSSVSAVNTPATPRGGGAAGAIPEGGGGEGPEGEASPAATVSPPTAGPSDAEDYLESGARRPPAALVSPGSATAAAGKRRSVFHESRDDLGGTGT